MRLAWKHVVSNTHDLISPSFVWASCDQNFPPPWFLVESTLTARWNLVLRGCPLEFFPELGTHKFWSCFFRVNIAVLHTSTSCG